MNNKSILIVTSEFPPQPGGIGNHAYNLATYLKANGCIVKVIADQRSEDGKDEARFDASLEFSVLRVKLYRWRLIMYLRRIIITFLTIKSSTHVIATGKFSLWNVGFCSFFFKQQTMAIIHGTEVNFKSLLLRKSIDFSLKRFDNIVAVSNYTKALVSRLNRGVNVIPNGINVSEWHNKKSKIVLQGSPVLTTVGRVSSRKGQLNVIQHLPELIQHFPDVHYHCVGIPSEADDFIAIAKSLNVASHITFHGSVDASKLKQILEATSIFVMLSSESLTGDVEGFGIAILEANALEIPAIGSKGCGIEDAIKSHYSGVLIDVDDANQLIIGINEILNKMPKFRLNAKSWAQIHDWDVVVKHYLSLLT